MRYLLLLLSFLTLAGCAPKPDPAHPASLHGTWTSTDDLRTLVLQKDSAAVLIMPTARSSNDSLHRTWRVAQDSATGIAMLCLSARDGIGGGCTVIRQAGDTLVAMNLESMHPFTLVRAAPSK